MKSLIKILLLVVLFPSIAFAHDFEVNGIYYKIDGTEASVTHKGNSSNEYDEYSGQVIIPSSVTYNGVTYSVTSIGYTAFENCRRLTGVTIPNSITTIGASSFFDCSGLTSLEIGSSVKIIGSCAFYGCTSLTSVTIPKSVTNIYYKAFYGCTALTTLNYNAVCADFGCDLSFMDYPPFYNTNITTINIGNSVQKIPGYFAYNLNNVTSITIPKTVTTIGSDAFDGCSGLTRVNITSIEAWYVIEFENICSNPLYYAHHLFLNGNEVKELVIPNSITSINNYAFNGCDGLTRVTISNSVTKIGDYAFHECGGLTNITIPNSVTYIGNYSFFSCNSLTAVDIPSLVTFIGNSAFFDCTALKTLNYNAIDCADFGSNWPPFYDSNLTIINIGTSVQKIPAYFAYGQYRLTNINIPNTVTAIGSNAFYGCSGLASINLGNSITTIGSRAFANCGFSNIDLPNSVTTIGSNAFNGCSELIGIKIPNLVTSISDQAFEGCTSLLALKLPKTLKSIGKRAFSSCSSLTEVVLPNSVTSIGNYAFASCSRLINITIPNSVTSIGSYAFASCSELRSVKITSNLTSIGEYAFTSCYKLSSFTCMTQTPPSLNNSNSFSTYNSTSLYVPRSGVQNYKTHTNWRRFSKIYEFVGYFAVPDVNVSKGKTVVIPVSMTNEADIIGFQTDIYLPEGFEFVKDGNDYVVDPSDRMARDHAIMCNVSEDGALRVLCYSPTNRTISGNEGELFYVTIKAPNDTVGEFSLWFKNTILTTSDTEELLSPDANTNLNVIPYLPGDANGNGEVSVIDIVTAAQYIIFQNPNPFLFEASDLNNDEQITVTDLALIANLILYPTMNAPKRVPSIDLSEDQIHGNDIHLNAEETRTVNITLDNVEKYSAFQMDLKLPDGLTACNFKMANQSDSHSFITSEEKDGSVRVLCYSPSLTALGNDEKSLLTFDVTATGNIVGDIIIDGIELVTTTCQSVQLNALAIGVNQTNSVSEVSKGKSVAHIDYYNLAGLKQAEPAKGVTIIVTTYTDGSSSTQKVIM